MKEKTVIIESPAKINLCLAITGKRGDGYHDLLSVVGKVGFGDRVEVGVNFEGDRLEIDGIECPGGEENLILKALRKVRELVDIREFFTIKLEKRIPVGAGFGGGSSNVVAFLKGMNRVLSKQISMVDLDVGTMLESSLTTVSSGSVQRCAFKSTHINQFRKNSNELTGGVLGEDVLMKVAGEVGADCCLFFYDGLVLMRGKGDVIERSGLEGWEGYRGRKVLIFKPAFSVSTVWAYSKVRRYTSKDVAEDLVGHPRLMNDFEEIIFGEFRELGRLIYKLREEMGYECLLSGSGSGCFILEKEGRGFPVDVIKSYLGEETFMVETFIE